MRNFKVYLFKFTSDPRFLQEVHIGFLSTMSMAHCLIKKDWTATKLSQHNIIESHLCVDFRH